MAPVLYFVSFRYDDKERIVATKVTCVTGTRVTWSSLRLPIHSNIFVPLFYEHNTFFQQNPANKRVSTKNEHQSDSLAIKWTKPRHHNLQRLLQWDN